MTGSISFSLRQNNVTKAIAQINVHQKNEPLQFQIHLAISYCTNLKFHSGS